MSSQTIGQGNTLGNVNIPGRYLTPEEAESFPLKRSFYDSAQSLSHGCCSYINGDDGGLGNPYSIYACFFVLSLAVTIILGVQIHYGNFELMPHGSVASDSEECSLIGTNILKNGGNAVDSAIATTLCLGVVNMHVTGLGSGGFMLIYSHRKQQVIDVIDFRETIPLLRHQGVTGAGSTVGVPGLLRGLGLAHKLYGKLPWKELVMPSVNLARSGFRIPHTLLDCLQYLQNDTKLYGLLSSLEFNQNITFNSLAHTMEYVAAEGPDALYNGTLAFDIIRTVVDAGGMMTMEDLSSYEAVHQPAIEADIANFTVYTTSALGGLYLKSVLEMLRNDTTQPESNEILNILSHIYHNSSEIRGETSKPVGSHVSAVDIEDLYVSVISGLNTWLGSQLLINNSFILNSALLNLNLANGSRPTSFSVPIIAVNKNKLCGRRLIFGCSDVTTGMQLLLKFLYEDNITKSVEAPRFKIISENKLGLEGDHSEKFSKEDLNSFRELGYDLYNITIPYESCNVIEKIGDILSFHSDSRGGGVSSGL